MNPITGTVYIVDDDDSFRRALQRLCQSAGLQVQAFACSRDFLARHEPAFPSCMLLDMCLPDLGGLDLQREMAACGLDVPIVFLTGQGDIPSSVRAIKAGTVDFLGKPFQDRELFAAVREALARDQQARAAKGERELWRGRWQTLTQREQEVALAVARGLLNKQVALELEASEQTIKVHRGRVMKKMRVDSVAELVQALIKLDLLGS